MKGLIITYLLTYGGAAAAPFSPYIGLVAYICLAILRPEYLWHWAVPPGNYSRIVAIATLVGWAIKGFGDWRFGKAALPVGAFITFFGWSIVAAAWAPDQDTAWHFVDDFSKIFLPVIVGATIIKSMKQIYILCWAITASMGYVCYEFNTAYLGGENIVDGWGTMGRAVIATALIMTTTVSFFLGLHERAWWRRLAAFGSCAMQFHAMLLSGSRGGMLGMMAIGIAMFCILPRRPSHYAMMLLAVLVAARLTGPQLVERYLTVAADDEHRDASAQGRLDLWSNCVDLTLKNPVIGVGPNHFPLVAPRYGWPAGKEAHQNWLCVAAEFGVPGLLFLVAFFGTCMTRMLGLMRASRDLPDPWPGMVARMVFAALVGYFVSSQFVTVKQLEPPYYIAMLGIAALKLSSSTTAPAEHPPAQGVGPATDPRVP